MIFPKPSVMALLATILISPVTSLPFGETSGEGACHNQALSIIKILTQCIQQSLRGGMTEYNSGGEPKNIVESDNSIDSQEFLEPQTIIEPNNYVDSNNYIDTQNHGNEGMVRKDYFDDSKKYLNDAPQEKIETREMEPVSNGLVSIKYPCGIVRPLEDNLWFNGIECVKAAPDSQLPHECLYRRICFGSETPIAIACTETPDYLKRMVYDRSELDENPFCARQKLCNRDNNPPQQTTEVQEKEKEKVAGSYDTEECI